MSTNPVLPSPEDLDRVNDPKSDDYQGQTETVSYPCGCSATGPGPLPNYCPEHGTPPSTAPYEKSMNEASMEQASEEAAEDWANNPDATE